MEISQKFVAFSEYMNFTSLNLLSHFLDQNKLKAKCQTFPDLTTLLCGIYIFFYDNCTIAKVALSDLIDMFYDKAVVTWLN